MKPLLILLGVTILLALVGLALKRLRGGSIEDGPWPFYPRRPLSAPEQVLYFRLVKALPECIVLAQVQVSRVLGVKKGENFHQWNNRINRLSYDFVVCSKDSTVIAAIELDDKSHESASRVEVDQRKDRATRDAGVRLIRWHVKSLPDDAQIRKLVGLQPVSALPEILAVRPAAERA